MWIRDSAGQVVCTAPDRSEVDRTAGRVDRTNGRCGSPRHIKAALAHLNLVLIHPFRYGNGRVARCFQTFVLAAAGIREPVFSSIEGYLGKNTLCHYAALAEVAAGEWSPHRSARPWIRFCLTSHLQQARAHLRRIEETELLWGDCDRAAAAAGLPDRVVGALCDAARGRTLHRSPYRRITTLSTAQEPSEPAATRDLAALTRAGLLDPSGSGKRRTYRATPELPKGVERHPSQTPPLAHRRPLRHLRPAPPADPEHLEASMTALRYWATPGRPINYSELRWPPLTSTRHCCNGRSPAPAPIRRSYAPPSIRRPHRLRHGWPDRRRPHSNRPRGLPNASRVPFGYLFLAEPPPEQLPLADFRRLRGAVQREPSLDLQDVVADTFRKQNWYREYRLQTGEAPFWFVGGFSSRSAVADVALHIANSLDFEAAVRPKSPQTEFLNAFVGQVEALGVLVLRNGIVRNATNRPLDPEEFRGFSIADPFAPAIFINSADSKAAQAFTLAHELAHIWVGEGGISDANLTTEDKASEHIEAYCNQVAGELLLPWNRIADRWRRRTVGTAKWTAGVSAQFHVSTVMVARQLWAHGAIAAEEFFSFYKNETAKWTIARSAQPGGGNFYKNVPIRNSRLLTEMILRSVAASETLIREASQLLGVKPAHLPKLQDSMGSF